MSGMRRILPPPVLGRTTNATAARRLSVAFGRELRQTLAPLARRETDTESQDSCDVEMVISILFFQRLGADDDATTCD
jgi:hypothetical protein